VSAIFSACRRFRYRLGRDLSVSGSGTCLFILLNPSTADEETDDPTVRRCAGFAGRWGHARVEIVNLFAWRSVLPEIMRRASDPVGPDNDSAILAAAREAAMVVCGWGNHGAHLSRGRDVLRLLSAAGVTPHALRLTHSGQPQHPLYLPGSLKPFPLEVP
jgi:hypothetical protein